MSRKLVGFQSVNQRRDMRKPMTEVSFKIGTRDYPVIDVSLGGFQIDGAREGFRLGQEIVVATVTVHSQTTVKMNARAEVVRTDSEKGHVGAHFIALTSRNFDVLESLIMRRPLVRPAAPPKKGGGLFGLFRR